MYKTFALGLYLVVPCLIEKKILAKKQERKSPDSITCVRTTSDPTATFSVLSITSTFFLD